MEAIDIPPSWAEIPLNQLQGVLLLVGATDTGKSTFGRYLFRKLAERQLTAYLDGDPGQSRLGPPTTMTLALAGTSRDYPPAGRRWSWFTGSTSPVRHMLPLLTGAARLVEVGRRHGAESIIYDTTGLVHPQRGGSTLKWAKVDLLRPTAVFAFQRETELERLLAPLRRRSGLRVFELSPSPAVRRRDPAKRQEHRARMFQAHFSAAVDRQVPWNRLAVYPSPSALEPGRLLALEAADGFILGLGLILRHDRSARQLLLRTPISDLTGLESLRVGDLLLEPGTFRDRPLKGR